MSNDTRLQQAKRSGDAVGVLKARLRSGELTEGRLRIAAYCGDAAARELSPDTGMEIVGSWGNKAPAHWENIDDGQLSPWTTGLLHLASECSPIERESECSSERCHDGTDWSTHSIPVQCERCGGTGRVTVKVPAEQHLAVTVGVAAARACLVEWKGCEGMGNMEAGTRAAAGCLECGEPRQAIEAAEAWLKEPSEAKRAEMTAHVPRAVVGTPWADCGALLLKPPLEIHDGSFSRAHFWRMLTSAATLLTEERVREIASAAGVKWAL